MQSETGSSGEGSNLRSAARTIRADRGDDRERLDRVLLRHLADIPEASRTRIQEWIETGQVLVNGSAVSKVSHKARVGDQIEVAIPPPPPPKPELIAQDIPLEVLYEDEHLLAINKPPGLVVHPAVGHRDGTLVNALLWRSSTWGGEATRPGLVHHLDKETSGVLLVAKTDAAHLAIARAMKARTIEKEYLAVVYGRVPVAKGRIEAKITRDPKDRKKMTTSKTEGRDSATRFERLAESAGPGEVVTVLKCILETGRTHQIRVHLKSMGWPIVGDPTYGAPRWKGIQNEELARLCKEFPRQALHARRVVLDLALFRGPLAVEAPLPADLAGLVARASRDSIGDES